MRSLLTLLLLVLWHITVYADELPNLGEVSESITAQKEERRLGIEFMQEVRSSLPLLQDDIINDYIENLGNKLVKHANTKRKNFDFFIVNEPMINAFAGPDGHIGINSGTIEAVGSESELAAVLAHEIAHVTQHHIQRLIANAKNAQMLAMAGTLAAAIIGSTTNNKSVGSVATGAAMASMGGAVQHMISFTREHEAEADNIGIKILYQAGFDPNAMPKSFENLQKWHMDRTSNTPSFLLTHPVTGDRIAEAKNRAERYATRKIDSNNTFNLIQNRCQVITSPNQEKTLRLLKQRLNTSHPKDVAALQYGYALALHLNGKTAESLAVTTSLQQQYPNEVLWQMLSAELELKNKKPDLALAILKQSLINHGNYRPLIVQYGKTLINAKKSQTACAFLRTQIRKQQNDPELYWLLAQAYAQNKQIADAYQAKAKAYTLTGYYKQAAILLDQALKIPKLSTNDKMIINAKIEQLKNLRSSQ